MSLLGSKKFRKIMAKGEIKKILQDRSKDSDNILWQTLSTGRVIAPIKLIYLDPSGDFIHLIGNFDKEKFSNNAPLYIRLSGKISILKTSIEFLSEKDIVVHIPEEITDEELRSISRYSFNLFQSFNSVSISFPNIYVKYANPVIRVKMKDVSTRGMGLVLTRNQGQYANLGEEIRLERLGNVKLEPSILGTIAYVDVQESGHSDSDLIYKIGVKLVSEIPKDILNFFINYVRVSEAEFKDK